MKIMNIITFLIILSTELQGPKPIVNIFVSAQVVYLSTSLDGNFLFHVVNFENVMAENCLGGNLLGGYQLKNISWIYRWNLNLKVPHAPFSGQPVKRFIVIGYMYYYTCYLLLINQLNVLFMFNESKQTPDNLE